MSRMNPQEYQILQDNKFNLYCSVLGVKEQCCFAPDKKVIERAFRKSALKCHPDKGGDPVVFKKLNEAYNKLIGHIGKLEQQTEAIELANSILIEISKTSVSKWHEKLKTRYGWFKTDNCKNIIFDGPFKQYMGRSKNTGNITVVLYEDPPDQIPKIHVRSSKYMAWIAEQMMPVHMHVEKGKTIQFDQWRIAHLAEFGICNFMSATPAAPTPEKKEPKPKTPKAKRREAREASERRAKTRRDSEPTPEPGEKSTGSENNKENTEPKHAEGDINGKGKEEDEDVQQNPVIEQKPFNCGHCGEGFNNLMDYALHKKICVPDEDFGFASGMQDVINNQYKTEKKVEFAENSEKSKSAPESKKEEQSDLPKKAQASSKAQEPKLQSSPTFQCEKCDEKFTNMVWYAKHKNTCQFGECTDPEATSASEPVSERNTKCEEEEESKSSENIPTKVNISEEPQKQSSPPKHSKGASMTNGQKDKSDNGINQKITKEEVLPTTKELKKDTKIDIPMPPHVDNTVKEKSENRNEGIKTGQNVKNDNDSSQKASKENIFPTPKEFKKDTDKMSKENIIPTKNIVKDMEVDSPVQQSNKNNVEDLTQQKSNHGTKTGKVAKPAKATRLNRTLSQDLDGVDLKKKQETNATVEDMDIDEPEIKKAEPPKVTPKKNDMPMGSLLTNLPTTAKPPSTAGSTNC